MYGPSLRTMDVSVFRYFQLTSKLKSQFRVQAYNVFNTPQFQNPGGEVDPGFNLPTNNNVDSGETSQITDVRKYTNRQVEFAVRLMF